MTLNTPILDDKSNPYSQLAGHEQYQQQSTQPSYPQQQVYQYPPNYPPQQGYPQQPAYPPQQGYPPQPGYPPQTYYQPQPGYPPQQQYPPAQPQYPPTQQYQPTQPQYQPAQPQENGKYDYDPMHIQYTQMSINQWSSVPNDPSPYSQYWNGPQAFEPQTFSTNQTANTKWNDLFWTIIFWINFVATLGFFGYGMYKFSIDYGSPMPIFLHVYMKPVLIGLGIALGVNIIHFCYVSFAPLIYIKMGFLIGVFLSAACCIFPSVKLDNYYFFLYPGFMLLFALIMWCICRPYFEVSAGILKQTCTLIRRYPSIIFLAIFQVIIDILINVIFCILVFVVEDLQISPWIYIYVVFSYLWISFTFSYVTYLTGAGLAASWYFLADTPHFPKHPVWQSFKRACTTSFGSAALAGFLLAVVETIKQLVSDSGSSDNILMCALRCVLLCILAILEAFIKWMNRYALIYCAIFGVPLKEGCRRWAELSCHRFVSVIASGCVISRALTYNLFLFTVMSGLIGVIVMMSASDIIIMITACSAVIISLASFIILERPIETMSDTLLVCFAECPERLRTTASELAESIGDMYSSGIDRLMS